MSEAAYFQSGSPRKVCSRKGAKLSRSKVTPLSFSTSWIRADGALVADVAGLLVAVWAPAHTAQNQQPSNKKRNARNTGLNLESIGLLRRLSSGHDFDNLE